MLTRIMLLALVWLLAGPGLAAAPIRVGVEDNLRPLSFAEPGGELTGFVPELLREMSRQSALEIEMRPGSWTVIHAEFRVRKLDALGDVSITAERRDYMDFSISHAFVHGLIYARAGETLPRRTADFAGKRVGTVRGGVAYLNAIAHDAWGSELVIYENYDKLFTDIQQRRCDFALLTRAATRHLGDTYGLQSGPVDDILHRFHFAVQKGDTATLEKLNESLALLRQNGTFDRLWTKWIGPTEPHPIRLVDLQPYMVPLTLAALGLAAVFLWQRRMLRRLARQAGALRESEARFRAIFEHAGIGIALLDEQGRPVRANPMLLGMLGYTEAELTARTFSEVIHPDSRSADGERYGDLLAGRIGFYQIEKRFQHREGRVVWGRLTVTLVRDTAEGRTYAIGMVEDVTEQKRTAEALKQTQDRLQAILDHSPAVILLKDLDGRYLLTNRLFNETHGCAEVSPLGRTIRDLVPAEIAHAREAHDREVIAKGEPISREERITGSDGTVRHALALKFPLRDAQGKIYAVGGVTTDITEYKRLQAQYLQAQKLEAFGQLAGGIAHDFNNVLAAIILHVNLMQMEGPLPPPISQGLATVQSSLKRATRLTEQLLLFSRRSEMRPQKIDLNRVVRGLLDMLGRVFGEHIELQFDPGEPAPWLSADPSMVEQVAMNLAINARDAMPGGGRLTMATGTVEFGPSNAPRHGRPGRFAWLRVSDTGCGMDAATLARIFEPFFTTKEVGRGTGLGLATVHGIVQQHSGWIEVSSEPRCGSVFSIYLPATDAEPPKTEAAAPQPATGGRETLLLVEDEPSVRAIFLTSLRRAGYRVLAAQDGHEALAQWHSTGGAIDLLLTDTIMPGGLNGHELAVKLRALKPTLRVIIASGYDRGTQEKAGSLPGAAFLTKPVDLATLLQAVRRALDQPA